MFSLARVHDQGFWIEEGRGNGEEETRGEEVRRREGTGEGSKNGVRGQLLGYPLVLG